MKSRSNLLVRFLSALFLAGGLATVIVKQYDVSKARIENRALSITSSEQQRLARENQGIPRLRAVAEEAERLLQENRDLPKLRNDVLQLRRQVEEMEEVRTENVRLAAELAKQASGDNRRHPPAEFLARASLKDIGLGSPEATVQTAFWAIVRGDTNRIFECFLEPEKIDNRHNVKTMTNAAAALVGYRIADKQTRPRGVSIYFETYPAGEIKSVNLTQVHGEWKIGGGNLYGK